MANNSVLFGVIGALGLVVAGGGLYVAKQEGAFGPPTTTAAVNLPPPAPAPAPAPTPEPAKPPVVAAPQPAPAPPPRPVVTQAEQLRVLILDARRAITRGDFGSAGRALDQAERIDARAADVVAARRDLREAEQRDTQQRGDRQRRIESLVVDARGAIARRDYPAANRLIAQAEQIDPQDRTVQRTRAELTQLQANRDDRRPDALIADARAAMARSDYAAAARLIEQAERIDPRDRGVQQARADLSAAQMQPGRDGRRIDALLGQARAAMERHDFSAAARLIEQAEQLDPRDQAVQQARADLGAAQQRAGRDNRRVDLLVTQARAAIARHDYQMADRLLDQAENIDARDRDVQQARAELNAARPGPRR